MKLVFSHLAYISGMSRSRKSKLSRWTILFLLIISGICIFGFYILFGPNTGAFTRDEYLFIRTGTSYNELIDELEHNHFISDMNGFKLVAKAMRLPDHVHAGRYHIRKRMSNYKIVRMLRSGTQEPVKLVINKLRTKKDFTRLVATNLEADSTELESLLSDSAYLAGFGVTPATAMAMVVPDTYEFFWNTRADKVLRKIQKNYARFWNEQRMQKAAAKGITPLQATVIASIVEEETNMSGDKPKIASVYLNRIKLGMPLQADPTVKFAIGDFAVKRVTGAMLQFNSPYNTYMYAGLPPGPICTPSEATINAVLNAPKTTYLYFCARPDFSGYSSFASTYNEQVNNANAYRRALDARGIH